MPNELGNATRDVDRHQTVRLDEVVENFLGTLVVHRGASLQHNRTDRNCQSTDMTIHTQPFNGSLSGTTRVSRYQKKHSLTHTHEEEEERFTQTTSLL